MEAWNWSSCTAVWLEKKKPFAAWPCCQPVLARQMSAAEVEGKPQGLAAYVLIKKIQTMEPATAWAQQLIAVSSKHQPAGHVLKKSQCRCISAEMDSTGNICLFLRCHLTGGLQLYICSLRPLCHSHCSLIKVNPYLFNEKYFILSR